ncbi:conjugal transfer protein, partial [Pseudomonas aeruginosa]
MNAPATSRRPTSRPAARIAALLIPLGIAATPLPSFADLPTLEDPSRGTGSGIM